MNCQEKVACVIPAAGCGERMELGLAKQFCMVAGKPLICHTLEAFLRVPWIFPIVVVTARDQDDKMQEALSKYTHEHPTKVCIVTGGATRHRSIAAGIEALRDNPPDYVIIHDGVRPLVPHQVIQDLIEAVHFNGAAGITRPLVSTVIAVDKEGLLSGCLDRNQYLASEMPQAFKFSLIQSAYMKCSDHDLTYGTECLNLVLTYCGVRAKIIHGPPELWKVTHKKDLHAANSLLKEESQLGLYVSNSVQGSPFHKRLCSKFSHSYKLLQVDEVERLTTCAKQVHIHSGKSVVDLVDDLACRIHSGGQTIVHVIHDSEYLGHSDAKECQRKARTIACGDVIICCTCASVQECSVELVLGVTMCILKSESRTGHCKILVM